MKKLISIIVLSLMGLLFVCAKESSMSKIKASSLEIDEIGSALCGIYRMIDKESPAYIENYLDDSSLSSDIPAVQLARELVEDKDLYSAIFSGTIIDDVDMIKLKSGCLLILMDYILDDRFSGGLKEQKDKSRAGQIMTNMMGEFPNIEEDELFEKAIQQLKNEALLEIFSYGAKNSKSIEYLKKLIENIFPAEILEERLVLSDEEKYEL